MKILCTIPGKFGDLLWALPTVKAINDNLYNGVDVSYLPIIVHVGIMPQYRSILPLLNNEGYIHDAFVIENWICTGSPHGDQPWEAPLDTLKEYDKVYHLGYRQHPGKNDPLFSFIARQQGITLYNPIPFISTKFFTADTDEKLIRRSMMERLSSVPTITYSFNESLIDEKMNFIDEVHKRLHKEVEFMDVSKLSWLDAAYAIRYSMGFIGCRSSNYVLACGVGQKVFVFEPNSARSKYGPWGTTFTCPYADETEVSYTSVYQIVDYIESVLKVRMMRSR